MASETNDVSSVHSLNAFSPMIRTLSPEVKDCNAEQPENASMPIAFTELPIVTEPKLEHMAYLQPVITQYLASNKSEIWP